MHEPQNYSSEHLDSNIGPNGQENKTSSPVPKPTIVTSPAPRPATLPRRPGENFSLLTDLNQRDLLGGRLRCVFLKASALCIDSRQTLPFLPFLQAGSAPALECEESLADLAAIVASDFNDTQLRGFEGGFHDGTYGYCVPDFHTYDYPTELEAASKVAMFSLTPNID